MSLTNSQPLLTLWDVQDYVLDQVVGGDYSPRNRRLAIDAIREAYEEIPARRDWRYYYRPVTIQTVASQTTGTIVYDYTGGTYERMVTLTGTTWPTDVVKYGLYVAGIRYTVDAYKTSAVITLAEQDAPAADIASSAYVLTRDSYELPDGIRKLLYLHDTNAPGRMLPCVEPSDIEQEQRVMRAASQPLMYACYRGEYASDLAVHFAPSPSTVRTYQGLALWRPRPLKILEYSIGTVATTTDSTTVTGTSTVFTSDMDGGVIRFSKTADASLPTDIQGEIDKNRLNPYAMQRIIRTKASGTSLLLEQAADTTLSGSGYRISSRIDIEPGSMRNAFLRCCEARFATQDRKGAAEREARYEKMLAFAMYADQRVDDKGGRHFMPNSLAGIASSITETTGGTQP